MKHLFTFLSILILCLPSYFAQLPGSGNSLDFGGTRYVNIPNTAALNPTSAITLEAWIKADSWRSQVWQGSIISKDGWAAGEQGYVLRAGANGTLSFNLGRGPSWEEIASPSGAMQANTWYHVAATWDGSIQRLFINGRQVATRNFSGSILNGTYDVRIGAMTYTVGGWRDFDGQIDEVRIWNQAVPQATLRNWMCQRLNASHPQDTALVAYYRFDETSGTVAADSSGNNLNGTLANLPVRMTSGAAIGDVSLHDYGSNPQLTILNANGDSIRITTASGSPAGLQFYAVNKKPNVATPPGSFTSLDTTQYMGVFPIGGTNPTFNLSYYYGPNPNIPATVACKLKVAQRTDNASTSWSATTASPNFNNNSITVRGQPRREFILGFGEGFALNNLGQSRFCEGDTTYLQVSRGSIPNYQWVVNGMAIPGATDSLLTVLQSGTYRAAISVAGCNDTSMAAVITVDPAPVITINYPPSVCEDAGLVNLSATPIGGAFSGTWINGSNFRSTAAGPGVHNFSYMYTDSAGCSKTQTDSITVLPAPTVNYNTSQNVFCQSADPVTLMGASPAGGFFSGPGVSNGMFDPGLAGVGFHPILYTYTNQDGCSATATQTLQVQGAPNVVFGSLPSVCINVPTFQLTTGTPLGGAYKGPGMTSIAFFDPMAAGVGTHTLTYVYTNAAGCGDSATQTIVVNDLPMVSIAPFDTFCADHGPITLDKGTPSGGTYSGPAVSNNIFDPSLLIAGAFPITYMYTDPLTGCSANASRSLRLFPVPPKPVVTPFGATLISSSPTGNQWYNSSNVLIPWAVDDTFVARGNGSYYVIVTNVFGCVSEPSDLFTINNVGIDIDLNLKDISVFPNPNQGQFQIQFNQSHRSDYQVRIHNLMGQLIQEESFSPSLANDQRMLVSLPEGISGLMLLTVESEAGKMSWKVWVE